MPVRLAAGEAPDATVLRKEVEPAVEPARELEALRVLEGNGTMADALAAYHCEQLLESDPDPEDSHALGERLGYRVAISWARWDAGALDVDLLRPSR